ncbi:MAG: protein kinase [Myxococcota bacterium]|nr:protein kinase [Myxococcota bacterium]
MSLVGRTLSQYDILDPLGKGGMGVVYKARDRNLLRDVAVKILSKENANEKQRKRFIQEARVASALSHPGIVNIHDFGQSEDLDYIVMELVDGISLAQKLKSSMPSLQEVLDWAKQIASAMAAAHAAGIIHRDLNPHNIMVTPTGQVKILDFGIAKLNPAADREGSMETIHTELTGRGHVLGTLSYMSPEQAVGDPVDARSDIFSFGIVLYELLSGKRPFEATSETSLLRKLHFDTPASLRSIRPEVPQSLDQIIQTALAKQPEKRHPSMAHIRDALDTVSVDPGFQSSLPAPAAPDTGAILETVDSVSTQPTPLLSRALIKLAEKPRTLLGLTAVLVVFAVVTTLFLTEFLETRYQAHPQVSDSRLAILPFENIGNDPDLTTLCVGLTESLTNGLGQVNEFKDKLQIVPAAEVRNSNIKTAKQTRELFGAGLVVGGSLQKENDQIRLNINLAMGTIQLSASTATISVAEQQELKDIVLRKTVGFLRPRFGQVYGRQKQEAKPVGDDAYAFFEKGMAFLQSYAKKSDNIEKIDSAVAQFQKALELDLEFSSAFAGISRAYLRKYQENGDPMLIDQATNTAKRAVELNPDLGIARVSLGLALVETGELKEAEKAFEYAIAQDPFSPDANLGLGKVWVERGELDKALVFLEKALDLGPSDREILSWLGTVYTRTSKYTEAEHVFSQVVELVPESFKAHSNLAGTYYMQGKLAQAATEMQRALEIEPSSLLYHNLGTLYFTQGRFNDALVAYKKAIEMPGGANYYLRWANLGNAYRFTKENESKSKEAYQCAIDLLQEKLDKQPANVELKTLMALYHAKMGDSRRAVQEMKNINIEGIQDTQLFFHLGMVAEIVGQRKQALDLVEKALVSGYSLDYTKRDPDLADLRQDPRFRTMLVRVKALQPNDAQESQ